MRSWQYTNGMIYLATDHRGFELKEKMKTWLTEWGLEFVDCGAKSYIEGDDYPDYVALAAEKVAQDPVVPVCNPLAAEPAIGLWTRRGRHSCWPRW